MEGFRFDGTVMQDADRLTPAVLQVAELLGMYRVDNDELGGVPLLLKVDDGLLESVVGHMGCV